MPKLTRLLGTLCFFGGFALLAFTLQFPPQMKPTEPSGAYGDSMDPMDEVVKSYDYTKTRQEYLNIAGVLIVGGFCLILVGGKRNSQALAIRAPASSADPIPQDDV